MFLFAHDLFGKSVSTFPDHAALIGSRTNGFAPSDTEPGFYDTSSLDCGSAMNRGCSAQATKRYKAGSASQQA
jgi:hypothetical protein